MVMVRTLLVMKASIDGEASVAVMIWKQVHRLELNSVGISRGFARLDQVNIESLLDLFLCLFE